MKIKHWQGYGTVEAKKISTTTQGNMTRLHIRVKGNHEYGIERNDRYDVANWLIKKFDKSFVDYRTITSMDIQSGIEDGVDTCDYIITYINQNC